MKQPRAAETKPQGCDGLKTAASNRPGFRPDFRPRHGRGQTNLRSLLRLLNSPTPGVFSRDGLMVANFGLAARSYVRRCEAGSFLRTIEITRLRRLRDGRRVGSPSRRRDSRR